MPSTRNSRPGKLPCMVRKLCTGPLDRLSRASVTCGTKARASGAMPTRRQAWSTLWCSRPSRSAGSMPAPQRVHHAALVETAGARDPRVERGKVDLAERGGDVLGAVAIDFADEFQRAMQLFVVLPARTRDAFHLVEKEAADGGRGADRDEQAMHAGHHRSLPRRGKPEIRPSRIATRAALTQLRFRLKSPRVIPILQRTGRDRPRMENERSWKTVPILE